MGRAEGFRPSEQRYNFKSLLSGPPVHATGYSTLNGVWIRNVVVSEALHCMHSHLQYPILEGKDPLEGVPDVIGSAWCQCVLAIAAKDDLPSKLVFYC